MTRKKKKKRSPVAPPRDPTKAAPPKGVKPYAGMDTSFPPPELPNFDVEKLISGEQDARVLRLYAGHCYATDLGGCTIAGLHQIEPFTYIPRTTLRTWSQEDDWQGQRQRFRESLSHKLADKVADVITQDRVDQVQAVMREADRVLDMMRVAAVPKSYEGMAGVWLKMQEFLEDMRTKMATVVSQSPLGEEHGVANIQTNLTEEEAKEAARAVVKFRQAEIRKKLKEVESDRKDK